MFYTNRRSPVNKFLPIEDLDRVAVRELVRPSYTLAGEAGRLAPDPRTGAAIAERVVDRVRDVLDRHWRMQRDRLTAVPQEDADESRQPPDGVTKRVEACVVENRHGHDLELRMGRRRR